MRIFPRRSAAARIELWIVARRGRRTVRTGRTRDISLGTQGGTAGPTAGNFHNTPQRRTAAQPHSLPVIFVSLPSCRTFPRQVGRWCVCTALRKPICPDELLTEAPGLGQTVKLSVQIMFNADVPWITIGLVGCFFSLSCICCVAQISHSVFTHASFCL